MFFRQKKAKGHIYLQIVENRWEEGKTRQRVLGTVGRLDRLQETGQLEALLESGARFAHSMLLLSEHRSGELPSLGTRSISRSSTGWSPPARIAPASPGATVTASKGPKSSRRASGATS